MVIQHTMCFVNALQIYIDHPERYTDIVVYNDKEVVIIKDMYPKSLKHYLIIPKSPDVTHVHPLDVFQGNLEFYGSISNYINKCKDIIVDSLIKEKYLPDDKLVREEFKNSFIKAGVHSIPSLRNLHIHVITKDFHSSRLKNKKHYNSFNTEFFVDFEKLENLIGNESSKSITESVAGKYSNSNQLERNSTNLINIIKSTPLTCSYCKKTFGSNFQTLKSHLNDEFCSKFPTF